MGEHEARHAICERRLADAGCAADQPGVRDAPAFVGVEQRLLGIVHGRTAPSFRAAAGLSPSSACLRSWRHRFGTTGAVRGCRRLLHERSRCARRRHPCGARPSIMTQRFGSVRPARGRRCAVARETRLTRLRSGRRSPSPRRLLARARPTFAGTSRMNVRSGTAPADGDAFEAADQPRVDVAERALIDAGRIDEAVADHPVAGGDRRADHVAHDDRRARRQTKSPRFRLRAAWQGPRAEYGG